MRPLVQLAGGAKRALDAHDRRRRNSSAHRTPDEDAAARGIFDGLLGLVVEAVVQQAAMGRSQGSEVGIKEHA
jgi:hypothetical protein